MRLTRILPDTTAADVVQVELTPGELEIPEAWTSTCRTCSRAPWRSELDSTFQRVVPVQAVVRLPTGTGTRS